MIPSDTSRDAVQVQISLLRKKSPAPRGGMAMRRTVEVIRAAKRAISRVHPNFSEQQIGHRFIQLQYGHDLAAAVGETRSAIKMDSTSDLLQALRPVLEELERLDTPHYIGGSVASSIHGVPRSTLDVDLVARPVQKVRSRFEYDKETTKIG